MRFPPPEVIATWPAPNYDNPVTRGPTLIIVELTFLGLALITVALRLWVRIRILHKSGWDDWIMVVAAIFTAGVTIDVILGSQLFGWDNHVWDLTVDKLNQGRKSSIAGQTIFTVASNLAKTSILLSYLRFAPERSLFRRLIYAAIALVLAAMVVFEIVLWTQCLPSSSYWDLYKSVRNCEAEGPPLMAQAIVTVITDVIVYALPMPTLFRKLSLPLKQRVGLMALFGIGSLVIIAGILRTYWIHYVIYETYDVTWEGFQLWIWTNVEVNLGVICGCVPSLRPLLFPGWSASSVYGNSGALSSFRPRPMDPEMGGEEMSSLTGTTVHYTNKESLVSPSKNTLPSVTEGPPVPPKVRSFGSLRDARDAHIVEQFDPSKI